MLHLEPTRKEVKLAARDPVAVRNLVKALDLHAKEPKAKTESPA